MRIAAFTICVSTLLASVQAPKEPVSLDSPDGRLTITFETAETDESAKGARQLVYSVSYQDKPLITASALRLDLRGQPPLGANVRIVGATKSEGTEAYRLVAGRRSQVSDRYEALRLDLEEAGAPGRRFSIEARAFDDAVAFRYVVPEQQALDDFRLSREHTEFNIAQDATTYALVLPHYRSMYESEYLKLPATAFANQGGVESEVLIGLPLLMKLPGTAWMAITEADVRDYAGMYLVNPSGSWTGHRFESRFPPHPDDADLMVSGTLPHRSPWRVLLVGAEPGRLIESTVLTSLNPSSAIEDTSWIQPGKAAWDWWSGSLGPDGKHAFTTAAMKYYVDFAARSGLEYMLVDAGWSERDDITKMNGRVDIPELVQYAGAKDVKIWVWCHWSGVDRQMDEAFSLYQRWGVAGVKIDFMSRDDQEMIDFYHRVAATAARYRLMVDFHGSTKPTGLERTYPNIMGYEAVLGMEQSKAGRRDNPDHHVMLPFTRMLGGLMDYTPGGFDNVTEADFVPRMRDPMVTGTRAHHLAMYIVYDSPFQMVSDHPSAYEGEQSFELIKAVPATWDETRVVDGEPGEYITIARRSGDDWYVGSMTSWTPRTLRIPLTFLGPGSYEAQIYADAPDADRLPKKVAIETKRVDRTMELEARLAPGGGYAVWLQPSR